MFLQEAIKGDTKGGSNPEISLNPKLKKYVCDSFEGIGKESQDNFNKYLRENVWCNEMLSNADKIDIMIANFHKLTPEQKVNFNVSNDVRVIKNGEKSNWGEWPDIDWLDLSELNKDTAKDVYNEVTGKMDIIIHKMNVLFVILKMNMQEMAINLMRHIIKMQLIL